MNLYRAFLNKDNNIEEKCCLGGFYKKVCSTTIKKLWWIQILPLDSYDHVFILYMPLLQLFLKLYQRKLENYVAILKWF